MCQLPPRDVHLQYQKWANEYGPIYSLMLGTKTMIVLSSDEAVRDLVDKRSAIYSDRQDHYMGQTLLSGGNRFLMMRYGSTWRMLRKMSHNLLNIQRSEVYVPYQDLENKQMMFELLTQPGRFLDSIRRYANSLTTSMTFGFRTVSFDDPRMVQLFHGFDQFGEIVQSAQAAQMDVFPLLRFLPDSMVPLKRRARELHRKEKALYKSHWLGVKQAVKEGTAKPCFCVDMAKAQEAEGFDDDLAAYTGGTMLEAGSDTTSNTLYGFVQAMLLFPEAQKKLQAHIDEVMGDRRPSMDDYSRLPYVRCCIKETLRWMPTTILAFPHAVTQDDMYLGYRIPKGSAILINAYAIQMDPQRHPEPRRYNPDRYIGDDLSLAESSANPDAAKRDVFVFGGGRRICAGIHVAERSLFLGVARLMWAFDIVPAKDESGNDVLPDPEKLTQSFVCMPEPFQATIRPRSEEKARLIREIWKDAQAELDPKTAQWKSVPRGVRK